jgi:hypothetical protein
MGMVTRASGKESTLKPLLKKDAFIVALSVTLQFGLGLFFGHVYDMRIFMATGFLVGTGQNPYLAQNLAGGFNNPAFQGITSVVYPPP